MARRSFSWLIKLIKPAEILIIFDFLEIIFDLISCLVGFIHKVTVIFLIFISFLLRILLLLLG